MKILNQEEIRRIQSLHESGKSERNIALLIGCSRSAVWGQLKKIR